MSVQTCPFDFTAQPPNADETTAGTWRGSAAWVTTKPAVDSVDVMPKREEVREMLGRMSRWLALQVAVIGVLGAIAGTASATAIGPWPLIAHQGGAYAAFQADLPAFEQSGLTLDITNKITNPGDGVVRYIDPRAVNLEWLYFGKYHCYATRNPCAVSDADKQAFFNAFQAELNKQHGNPSVVGYYILDDYVGNIPDVLQKLHDMIALDNATAANIRPTVCGFGGNLDFHAKNLLPGVYEREYASLARFSKLELLNFRSTACDVVDLYIYSLSHRSPVSDYSMHWTMPAMLSALRQHGWNSALTPLIGSPQTWEGVPPTAQQVRTQTAAFCCRVHVGQLPVDGDGRRA
jgi:hypothetical protein